MGLALKTQPPTTLQAIEGFGAHFVTLAKRAPDAPGMVCTNKYITADGAGARPVEYPWLQSGALKGATVLEPFKEARFAALDMGLSTASEEGSELLAAAGTTPGLKYAWKVERPPQAEQNAYELDLKTQRRKVLRMNRGMPQTEVDAVEPLNSGAKGLVKSYAASSALEPLVHTFTELGLHHVTLDVTYPSTSASSSGSASRSGFFTKSVTAKVVVKYVRREMHSVDDEDRVALFAAWKVLLTTSDAEGRALYGDNFMSHGRLSAEHNNLAGEVGCDHLHDGMGFVPAHVSVNRLLEASLQSVDASVSLPYWEYTIDVEEVIANKNGDFSKEWRTRLAFTDKWFGDASVVSGHVTTGTFANFRLTANEYTTQTNGYGLIRSPWNNLKDPRFARYFGGGGDTDEPPNIFVESDQMSTCANLQETLTTLSLTLGAFNGAAAGQAHGPIHMFTGGQSGTPGLVKKMTEIGFKASGKDHNQFWGSGVTFFFANIKSLYRYGLWHCASGCDETTAQEDCSCTCDTAEIMASDAKTDLLDSYSSMWSSQGMDGDATLEKMLDLMCGFGKSGDGNKGSGGISMGDHASSGAASDPSFWILHGAVERWLALMRMQDRFESEDWDTPVFDSNVHPYLESCVGHAKDDTLVFGDIDGSSFTNGQYYDYLSPKEPNTPYVYDNFEWKHCAALGYGIKSAPDKTDDLLGGTLHGSENAPEADGETDSSSTEGSGVNAGGANADAGEDAAPGTQTEPVPYTPPDVPVSTVPPGSDDAAAPSTTKYTISTSGM